jgi:hypothetical protein
MEDIKNAKADMEILSYLNPEDLSLLIVAFHQ